MQTIKPTSFKLFILAIIITVASILFASLAPGAGFIVIFAGILILTFVLSAFGLYSGLKNTSTEHTVIRYNKIGLIGNALILLFNVCVIVYALSQIK
ncbi:hypothetical protein [uncultured Cytophaga sp.]|uniref:hypothetical protein n=1 Tax=uncultured Cytophaga sp. TaxID=160238 RepID=UPI002620246C|nr:hypothetical protein [uncultured Cytophaga sp.]